MSLPLTRRIARAALLIAAGAAPVVGAAGSAGAATTDLPANPELAGLTALDNAQLGTGVDGAAQQVDGAAQKVTGLAGDAGNQAVKAGGQAVKKVLPTANGTGGNVVRTAAPVAQKVAADAAGQAGGLLGGTAQTGLPGLPGQLPVQGLPLGG
ncbi:ATP-binding protein [Streptomyces chiangmaiensis]|uniref:ATP-binding protein n=1 Tax=Streptomyces chiangmaiensis TaxID=766497 RepID=A0ABU7FJB5_9ACTN|nr:ATP-binding protein [Streptomyces chiangmaiensis]MED7824071.1 ATP-binding protein [Streptomyces chiangmaiensis]